VGETSGMALTRTSMTSASHFDSFSGPFNPQLFDLVRW